MHAPTSTYMRAHIHIDLFTDLYLKRNNIIHSTQTLIAGLEMLDLSRVLTGEITAMGDQDEINSSER